MKVTTISESPSAKPVSGEALVALTKQKGGVLVRPKYPVADSSVLRFAFPPKPDSNHHVTLVTVGDSTSDVIFENQTAESYEAVPKGQAITVKIEN